MGKAKIKEHLGEAHYRIALDIDIAYAKKQVEALLLEIEARKVQLEESKQKRDDLKLAFDAAGVALKDYLSPLQAESEAAYAAMQAAYEAWLSAVQNQPDPDVLTPLRDAMDAWFNGDKAKGDPEDGFLTRHNNYIKAVDGEEGAPIPDPVEAYAARDYALQHLLLAMGDWSGAAGGFIDSEAVNDALDALGIALDEFEAATIVYADSPVIDPALKSAMEYYQSVYEDAHSEWVKSVNENSGDAFVKETKKNYDAAIAAFETAQKGLSATLNDGSMPPGLAEKYQAMLEAETRWRVADQEYRALLIAQALPTKQVQYLNQKLSGYVTAITVDGNGNVSGGEPIDQPANAWCVDYSEELPVGTEVATIEIPGERDIGVRIRPGYENRYTYTASRDGKLQPSWSSSPEATFFNWAVHPGANKWKPNYRLGEILFIDPVTEKCTVQLDEQKNNEKSKGYDWLSKTLDMNNIVRFVIDPETGEQTAIQPGPNIQVSDGIVTLTDVTIEYMECNAAVFEVGDHVMVEFTDRSWLTPKVIGFAENPRPCKVPGIVFASTTPAEIAVFNKHDDDYRIKHVSGTIQEANIWWKSLSGKVVGWVGPLGRNVAPRPVLILGNKTTMPGLPGYRQCYAIRDNSQFGQLGRVNINPWSVSCRFSNAISVDGRLKATVPPPHSVLGAGIVTYTENSTKIDYLVAVCCRLVNASSFTIRLDTETEYRTYDVLYCRMDAITNPNSASWVTAVTHIATPEWILPPINLVAFSESGTKFASTIPRVKWAQFFNTYDRSNPLDDFFPSYPETSLTADVIMRGTVTATADGIEASISFTEQADGLAVYSRDVEVSSMSSSSSSFTGIDYYGETEIHITSSLDITGISTWPMPQEGVPRITNVTVSGSLGIGSNAPLTQTIAYNEYAAGVENYDLNSTGECELLLYCDLRYGSYISLKSQYVLLDKIVTITNQFCDDVGNVYSSKTASGIRGDFGFGDRSWYETFAIPIADQGWLYYAENAGAEILTCSASNIGRQIYIPLDDESFRIGYALANTIGDSHGVALSNIMTSTFSPSFPMIGRWFWNAELDDLVLTTMHSTAQAGDRGPLAAVFSTRGSGFGQRWQTHLAEVHETEGDAVLSNCTPVAFL